MTRTIERSAMVALGVLLATLWGCSVPQRTGPAAGHSATANTSGDAQPPVSPYPEDISLGDLIVAIEKATADRQVAVVLDPPLRFVRWQTETWGNPVTVRVEEQEGVRSVVVERDAGKNDKWVLSMTQNMDLRAYGFLEVDVLVQSPVAVSAAVWTKGNDIYESVMSVAGQNQWQRLRIPLTGDGFKAASSDWSFGTKIANPETASKLALIFYAGERCNVRFRNVRLVAIPFIDIGVDAAAAP